MLQLIVDIDQLEKVVLIQMHVHTCMYTYIGIDFVTYRQHNTLHIMYMTS